MNMKKIILGVLVIGLCLFNISCDEGNVLTTIDPDVQLEEDLEAISAYIDLKGYTNIDTTASGAFYTIIDEGNGAAIELNDIVSFHFILRSAEDDLSYQTSILEFAEDEDIFGSGRIYEPEICTFTNGPWFVSSLTRVFSTPFAEPGYKEGVIACFGKIKVGGRAIILIPSSICFGSAAITAWGYPANTPAAIEIRPVYKR